MWELSVKVHTGYFTVVRCCFFLSYRHTRVLVCTQPGGVGGLISRQESKEARGRPHATSRRGREVMEKREEVKIPKPLAERGEEKDGGGRRRQSGRAAPVEQQVRGYERRWEEGEWGPGEQAGWRRGNVQEETHQQRGLNFSPAAR